MKSITCVRKKHHLMSLEVQCLLRRERERPPQKKSGNQSSSKGVRKSRQWWWLHTTVCVSSPALSRRTAACQPAEPMRGGGVCWGAGVSKVSAEPSYTELSRAEMDAEGRARLLPLRDTDFQRGNRDCWSRRLSQTEHESQERPWHMMDTNAGREAASSTSSSTSSSSSYSPPLPAHNPSPLVALCRNKTPEEEGEKGKDKMMLESQWLPVELWPPVMCGLWCCPRCLEGCRTASKRP